MKIATARIAKLIAALMVPRPSLEMILCAMVLVTVQVQRATMVLQNQRLHAIRARKLSLDCNSNVTSPSRLEGFCRNCHLIET